MQRFKLNPLKQKAFQFILLILSIILIITSCTNRRTNDKVDGKTRVIYWEKWTGFEGDAMRDVVNTFNKSQNKIYVDLLTVSEIDRKALVAIAGGDPPDVVGLWQNILPLFSDKNALMPLDDMCAEAGIKRENYITVFWDNNTHRGHLYALPTTPASVALHWNKRMFREAGLDPNRPPKTIKELDEYARKLTKKDKNGHIIQAGFLPSEPGWWNWAWGYWFGGRLWDGLNNITCNSPDNIKAFEWIQGYSKTYGKDNLQSFKSGFGNFASPQNAFLAEKVAMELQGVWMYNFIKNYAPKLEWGCAPFPSNIPGVNDVSYVEADLVCIPQGAAHPKEAFEFIKFVQSQKGMEMLCMEQRKFSPLINVSPEFIKNHPHPYIQLFTDISKSPHTFTSLDMSLWNEYVDDLNAAFDNDWLENGTPKQILDEVQARMQKKWNKELLRYKRLGIILQPAEKGR